MCDLQPGRVLGEGSFGKVTLVTRTLDGQEYVFKTFKDATGFVKSLNEIDILSQRSSPSSMMTRIEVYPPEMCKLGADEDGKNGGILMQQMDGDVYDLKRNLTRDLPFDIKGFYRFMVARDFICDMAKALDCLHSNLYYHGDFKPANVLYKRNSFFIGGLPRYSFYLSDFGGAMKLSNLDENLATRSPTFTFTTAYAAPELLFNQLTVASDIYSLGVSVLQFLGMNIVPIPDFYQAHILMSALYTRENIEKHIKEKMRMPHYLHGKHGETRWNAYIDNFINIVASMVDNDPDRRPTAGEIYNTCQRLSQSLYPNFDIQESDCELYNTFILTHRDDTRKIHIVEAARSLHNNIRFGQVRVFTLALCLFIRYICNTQRLLSTLEREQVIKVCEEIAKYFFDNFTNFTDPEAVADFVTSPVINGLLTVDPLCRANNEAELRERLKLENVNDVEDLFTYIDSPLNPFDGDESLPTASMFLLMR